MNFNSEEIETFPYLLFATFASCSLKCPLTPLVSFSLVCWAVQICVSYLSLGIFRKENWNQIMGTGIEENLVDYENDKYAKLNLDFFSI